MEIEDKRFLVTGGAGFIGSHVVDQLVLGHSGEVIVVDNFVRGRMENLEQALKSKVVRIERADIRHPCEIRHLFEGVDGVFHLAAIRITRCAANPRECLEVLIDGTFNVLEAAVGAGVKKVVFSSTASVYGMANAFPTPEIHHPYNNDTWYGAAKLACEGMLRSFKAMYGLNYIALRYFNVYGPRMDVHGKYTEVIIRWLEAFDRNERPKVFGDGDQTMDFVYVEDVARANLFSMRSEVTDEVFNIGSGKETSLVELLEVLSEAAGVNGIEPEFLPARQVNPVARRLAAVEKAKSLLGFRPGTALDEGLRNLVLWRKETLSGCVHK